MNRKPVDTAHEVQRAAARREVQRQTSEALARVAAERDRLRVALADIAFLVGARGPATVDELATLVMERIGRERTNRV